MASELKVDTIKHTNNTSAITLDTSGNVIFNGEISGYTHSLSHRNMILNGDFRINQRSATSRTQTSSAYNYDRWYWDGSYLYQGVEDKNVRNGTFTLSWTDSGSDITAHYVVSTDTASSNGPDSGLTWTSVSNGGQITVNETTEYSKHLWIRFGGTVANLSKVQLEEGSVATPFEHRSYADELARCQRYYYVCKNLCGSGQATGSGQVGRAMGTVIHPTTMRASPTFSVVSGSYSLSVLTNSGVDPHFSYGLSDTSGNVGATSSGSGSICWAYDGVMSFDAEL